MGDPPCWAHLFDDAHEREAMTTSAIPRDLDAFFQANERRIHGELFDFLRIPSVSAKSEHRDDTARAADWLARDLERVGLTAKVHPTAGHPIVVVPAARSRTTMRDRITLPSALTR